VLALFFAALAGMLFGALAVAIRNGLQRADAHSGAVVVAVVAAGVAAAGAVVEGGPVRLGQLWPFFVAGLLVPGVSQILFIKAIRDAGPSRAVILIGTAPLISVLIALTLLGEPFQPGLIAGTVLVVAGGAALTRERTRPEHFRTVGLVLALACAALFAVRDNVVRWAARDAHPPPLLAATVSLLAAAVVLVAYVLVLDRERVGPRLRAAAPAFAVAGIALGTAYCALLEALDRGRVSVVAPLNATQSLWAVAFAAVFVGRASEAIGRRLVVASLLVVAGSAVISVVR
jgi:drug/metabolite transporter (DMT)-like permease